MDDHSQQIPVEADEEILSFDARRYLDGLKKYVWVVLAIEALAITLAVIYTHRQPSILSGRPRRSRSSHDCPTCSAIATRMHANVGGIDYYMQQKEVLGSYTLVKQTVTSTASTRISLAKARGR